MKIGDAISITFDGTKFPIPKGTEIEMQGGGETITETQGYGDGTADSYVSIETPKLKGVKVKVSTDNEEKFEQVRKTPDIPITLQCVAMSVECTGSIVGEITVSTNKLVTNDFEVHVTDGTGFRKT